MKTFSEFFLSSRLCVNVYIDWEWKRERKQNCRWSLISFVNKSKKKTHQKLLSHKAILLDYLRLLVLMNDKENFAATPTKVIQFRIFFLLFYSSNKRIRSIHTTVPEKLFWEHEIICRLHFKIIWKDFSRDFLSVFVLHFSLHHCWKRKWKFHWRKTKKWK